MYACMCMGQQELPNFQVLLFIMFRLILMQVSYLPTGSVDFFNHEATKSTAAVRKDIEYYGRSTKWAEQVSFSKTV